jgi:CcmD family protein
MTPFHYLWLAYGFVWAMLGLYLFLLGRRVARMRGELEELKRRLARD